MKKFLLILSAFLVVLSQSWNSALAVENTGKSQIQDTSEYVPVHPKVYVDNADREKIWEKINKYDWAKEAYENIRYDKWYNFYDIEFQSVEHYVNQHIEDPEWMSSRMAMYWKEGEHYTQTYVKDQNFDYGEGNAPVPTVRLPGMRTWNSYINPPLEQMIPYNETGDMLAIDRNNRAAGLVKVPYKQTGHMVRYNNRDIMETVERASFLYWLTGEEKFAKFASSVVWKWILGIYYMKPPLDPEKSLEGPGGYEPGGISGYYDYEVIHDDTARLAAVSYDFLYDYLVNNPDPHLKELGINVTDLFSDVFKRFIEIGFVRGNKSGNWNTNGWQNIMNLILVLESNDYYPDGKGREYYLHYFTTESTQYHEALPDIMKTYDPVTGLWPESPTYALGTINQIVSWAVPILKSGNDIIKDVPMVQKAVNAIFPWLDPRGNMVVLGDGRGGTVDVAVLEQLLTYYTLIGDQEKASVIGASIKNAMDSGIYKNRGLQTKWTGTSNWVGLATFVGDLSGEAIQSKSIRTAYSDFHRHITMKNKNDIETGLMATLYGGRNGSHMNPQGLAMQLYGKGWALGVDSAAYESYWSSDYGYHSGPAGANTVMPGYKEGDIVINGIEPAPAQGKFTNDTQISDDYSFSDVTASEKRRLVSIVRTSPTTGYYVDIFRSDQNNNDYIYHNLGNKFEVLDTAGSPLNVKSVNGFGDTAYENYNLFNNHRSVAYNKDFNAKWTIAESTDSPQIVMDMWMKGQEGRTVFQVDAPPATYLSNLSPNGVNSAPQTTPTLIVRQTENNAAKAPFVSVFESYDGNNKSISKISDLSSNGNFVGIQVDSKPLNAELEGRKDYIVSASDDTTYTPIDGMAFRGMYGIATETKQGFKSLYLGSGKLLQKGAYKIASTDNKNVAAGVQQKDGKLYYSANSPVELTIPYANTASVADYSKLRIYYTSSDGRIVETVGSTDPETKTITGTLPMGNDSQIFVAVSLETLLKTAKTIQNDDNMYTPESFESLQLAIKTAEASNKIIHSAEELQKTITALKSAIEGLIVVDINYLSTLVNKFLKENAEPGSQGVLNSMTSILDQAKASEERGNTSARNNQLNAFVNQVKAQRGKVLTDKQDDALLFWVQVID